jgi:hypothetical protein
MICKGSMSRIYPLTDVVKVGSMGEGDSECEKRCGGFPMFILSLDSLYIGRCSLASEVRWRIDPLFIHPQPD